MRLGSGSCCWSDWGYSGLVAMADEGAPLPVALMPAPTGRSNRQHVVHTGDPTSPAGNRATHSRTGAVISAAAT